MIPEEYFLKTFTYRIGRGDRMGCLNHQKCHLKWLISALLWNICNIFKITDYWDLRLIKINQPRGLPRVGHRIEIGFPPLATYGHFLLATSENLLSATSGHLFDHLRGDDQQGSIEMCYWVLGCAKDGRKV